MGIGFTVRPCGCPALYQGGRVSSWAGVAPAPPSIGFGRTGGRFFGRRFCCWLPPSAPGLFSAAAGSLGLGRAGRRFFSRRSLLRNLLGCRLCGSLLGGGGGCLLGRCFVGSSFRRGSRRLLGRSLASELPPSWALLPWARPPQPATAPWAANSARPSSPPGLFHWPNSPPTCCRCFCTSSPSQEPSRFSLTSFAVSFSAATRLRSM